MPAASSRSASSPATALPLSPRPGRSSRPASSAPSTPGPGRSRCRCRPASAAATPMSTSSPVQLDSCDPRLLLFPAELTDFCQRRGGQARDRRARLGIAPLRWKLAAADLPAAAPDDIAYLQYSSGSTRFPHGVAVTHAALLHNLRAHGIGLKVRGHRPRHLLVALVPRHGPRRVPAVAGRDAVVGRLSEDRGFRPPAAGLARPDHPQPRHHAQLFADLRLRHLLAPDELADPRRGPLRPLPLAHRRQWRGHDPPRRDAGVRRRFRRRRLRGLGLLPQLRPCRSDARGVADAAGRGHPARAGRGA